MQSTHRSIPSFSERRLWNSGRLVGQKPPLKCQDIWAVRVWLQIDGRKQDLALFNLAIDSKLRGCDLVAFKITDVWNGDGVATRAMVIQKMTGRHVRFEIAEPPPDGIKAALICRRTHNLRAVQLLLGRTKLESTVRHLGIEVDDGL